MTAPVENKDETLTIRLSEKDKARLYALAAKRQKLARAEGGEVTATSLARGAVRRMLDDAEKTKGAGR